MSLADLLRSIQMGRPKKLPKLPKGEAQRQWQKRNRAHCSESKRQWRARKRKEGVCPT